MIAKVTGRNRGYFEIDKVYNGKPYVSRFIQIEQVQQDGQIRIEKVNVPNQEGIISKVAQLKINDRCDLMVKFGVYNGFLTKKVVSVQGGLEPSSLEVNL